MTVAIPGRPRSLAELVFAAGLVPCPGCGARELGAIELTAERDHRLVRAPCPRCRTPRDLAFELEADQLPAPAEPLHLGGPEPSQVIRPVQLVEELDRLAPRAGSAPGLSMTAAALAMARVATCLIELVKFVPPGADAIPDDALDAAGRADRRARPERYARGWLTEQRDGYLELLARHSADELTRQPLPPRGELTRATLEAHRDWVLGGGAGDGRLDLANVDLTGVRLGAWELTGARLHELVLDRASLGFTSLARSELVDLSAVGASLEDCSFAGARLVRCDLIEADLSRGKLDDAVVGGGRWDGVILDGGSAAGARFVGVSLRAARFGNAALDGAAFLDCDLRGASFAAADPGLLGTTRRARFERCDLRETRWSGRDLGEAVLIECHLAGATGRPRGTDGIVLVRADLSPSADGSVIGSAGQVLAMLAGEPE